MKTILCLHALLPNLRETTFRHIYSFPRYGPGNLYVFHNIKAPVTDALRRIPFDGVILNYCFLSHRSTQTLGEYKRAYSFINESPATKIAICQDDYTCNEVLDRWLEELGVSIVYSPIARDLEALYPTMTRKPGVEFREGLTSYVDDDLLSCINSLTLPFAERQIDVGTRVRAIGPYLGRHAQKKAIVSERFCHAAADEGLVADCSTDPKDVLLGNDWLRFLGSCRTTIGSRGGGSMADPDGSIKVKCLAYLEEHPQATYDEVKAACFPERKDTYRFDAISPRLFEAAATRTCQVLIKDDYLGLVPYEDYIPLEEDFSNLPEVLDMLRNSELLMSLADSAHRKLIASGRFSFDKFVHQILDSISVPSSSDPEIIALIKQHFDEIHPFAELDKELGSLTAQTAKRTAQRYLRDRPDANLADAFPEPRVSAIASLIRGDSFPRRPEHAIRSQMLSNWSAAHGIYPKRILARASKASLLSKGLEAWGFCECIYDAPSGPQEGE